jgi:hypothetical protein
MIKRKRSPGLLKDADKLKLMLLAWNYQNSNAVRNGTDGPDLNTMTGLWQQYQTALGLSNKTLTATSNEQAVSFVYGLREKSFFHKTLKFEI